MKDRRKPYNEETTRMRAYRHVVDGEVYVIRFLHHRLTWTLSQVYNVVDDRIREGYHIGKITIYPIYGDMYTIYWRPIIRPRRYDPKPKPRRVKRRRR